MNKLIKNARWMDGFVWFVVCGFGWLAYETLYLGVPITAGLLATVFMTWGAAGVGFALISGHFSKKSAELKRNQTNKPEVRIEASAEQVPDRAVRRRAKREGTK
jgi:hypothetical protein